jgi:hypothetical protein
VVEKPEFTETEQKALAVLAAARDRSTPREPISASFAARMASATVDPDAGTSDPDPHLDDHVIIRP